MIYQLSTIGIVITLCLLKLKWKGKFFIFACVVYLCGGIWINQNYQGKGYGIEGFSRKIQFAFNELNIRKLENGYFKGNEGSWEMQEKLGYKKEGLRRKKYICLATGKEEDEILTGLFKEEWLKVKEKILEE